MRDLRLVSCLLLALVSAACAGPASSGPASSGDRPPVILIVVDTLRADHTTIHGYERPTTPRLAELAATGSVFDWAFSAAAWTLPGVGSILTGRLEAEHGAGRHASKRGKFNRLRDDVPTLAEKLAAAGYTTAGIANGGYLHPEFGLDRGFHRYDFHPATDRSIRRADDSVDLALEWVDEWGDEPFFLMLHLFDVHRHYDAPEPARGAFTEPYADEYGDTLRSLESRLLAEERGDLEFHVAAYDEEILWVDMQIDRFVEGLRERGVWDRAVVALTADHGEAFREHNVLGHGVGLFNEVLRVPLIFWGPEVPARRWRGPASTLDIMPTLLAGAGLDLPEEVTGLSLYPMFRGAELPPRLLYAQNDMLVADHVAVIRWPLKLIHDFDHEVSLLFDLERDPEEQVDLADSSQREHRRLVRELRQHARDLHRGNVGAEAELDEDLVEELRALGYIQ